VLWQIWVFRWCSKSSVGEGGRDLSPSLLRSSRAVATSSGRWKATTSTAAASSSPPRPPQGRRHFHPDHLGTPRLITNATGQQVAFHTYYPFGEEATAPNQDTERLKFTGHERDFLDPAGPGDDLDAMRARYCSPITGRFLGVDPASASASAKRPQSWNRYSYSLNNPANVIDPDGRNPVLLIAGAVLGGLLFGPDPANTPTSANDPGVASSQGMNAVGATIGSVGVIALVKQFFTGGARTTEAPEPAADVPASPGPKPGSAGGPTAGGRFPESVKREELARTNGKCVFCKEDTTSEHGPKKLEYDHAHPRSRGGNASSENIQGTCRTCNRQKNTMTTEEFLEYLQRQAPSPR
jgi:RHS repeat-associated protein